MKFFKCIISFTVFLQFICYKYAGIGHNTKNLNLNSGKNKESSNNELNLNHEDIQHHMEKLKFIASGLYERNKSSFVELSSKIKSGISTQHLAKIKEKAKAQMNLSLMMIKKKRYTELGKVCAATFSVAGKTYDNCCMEKTPDNQDPTREWCYIKNDQQEDNQRDWDFCLPDNDLDEVRKKNQEFMKKTTLELNDAIKQLEGTCSKLNGGVNQAANVEKEMMELDKTVNDVLSSCQQSVKKMENMVDGNKNAEAQKQYALQLGTVLAAKDAANAVKSSFLELSIKDPLQFLPRSGPFSPTPGPVATGAAAIGYSKGSAVYSLESEVYGGQQKTTDDVLTKEREVGHSVIAPFLQEKTVASTRNGAGLENYEEDSKGNGLTGLYYDNPDFLGNYFSSIDATIDLDFTGASPAPNINKDNFSVRWSGFILAPHSGKYYFFMESDGGMSLSIREELILSKDMNPAAKPSKKRDINFLNNLIREKEAVGQNDISVQSLEANLIGGNKYKIVVSYVHKVSNMVKEGGKVYIKLSWESDNLTKRIVETKYLFTENVFDAMKATGFDPDTGIPCKMRENDLPFKDADNYIMTDIPSQFLGLNMIKLNSKYYKNKISFELNNPSVVYLAYPEPYDDPTPKDFMETNQIINVHLIEPPQKHLWSTTKSLTAKNTIPFKIKMKSFDAGMIQIPLNMSGTNQKYMNLILFYGYDRFNSSPVTCGGKEIWISKPTTDPYSKCRASSENVSKNQNCEAGLNGIMVDEDQGGTIWSSLNQGKGAWLQVEFSRTFQVSRIEYVDRKKPSERTKELMVQFSNGNFKVLEKQNTNERREFKIDPPQKSNSVKLIIKEVYSTGNNGGAFKIYGYECSKADQEIMTPESIGQSFVTGTKQTKLPNLFQTQKNKPIKLDCNDTLFSTKLQTHDVSNGSTLLIVCTDSCITSDPNLKIYGYRTYSADSIICKAAAHAGKIPAKGPSKLFVNIKEHCNSLKGKFISGLRSFDKEYSKYCFDFTEYSKPSEINVNEGSSIDLKLPGQPGYGRGKISKVDQGANGKVLTIKVRETGKETTLSFPNQDIFACGTKVEDKQGCEDISQEYSSSKSLKFRFFTKDSNNNDGKFLPDFGEVLGTKGSYGWSEDMTKRVVKRNNASDPRLQTLVEFYPGKKTTYCKSPEHYCSNAMWSAKTGPGVFTVKVEIGDTFKSRLFIKVNDKPLTKGIILESNQVQIFETQVQAVNDFVTIKSECDGDDCFVEMGKMNSIEITPVMNEDTFMKAMSNSEKKPLNFDPCGKANSGGRCEDEDPTNCLYEDVNDKGVSLCSGGNYTLIKIKNDYKCVNQREKLKCVLKSHETPSLCQDVCPGNCKKNQSGNGAICE